MKQKQIVRDNSETPKSAVSDFGVDWLKTEITERLRAAAKKAGGNQVLSEKSGVPLRTLSNYISGRSEPKVSSLAAIAKAASVRLDWLATGEGDMPRPHVLTDEDIDRMFPNYGKAEKKVLAETRAAWRSAGFVMIPRYDIEASAGPGALAGEENVVDYMAFREEWVRRSLRADPAKLVLISATGDSMEPTIRSGDLLLVDTGITDFIDDAIYVVGIEERLVVKRVQSFMGGAVTIKSDNAVAYVEQTLAAAEAEAVRVAGRVRWIGRLI